MDKKRILYIDDETDLLDLAASFFEDEGLPIEVCSEFDEALRLIKENKYDLIISDAKMPTGSGLELFKIIKTEKWFQGEIILVTGNLENSSQIDKYYDHVIYKPIQFQELVDKVKSLLFISS